MYLFIVLVFFVYIKILEIYILLDIVIIILV